MCLRADMNPINMNLFRLCFPPGVEFLCLVRTLGKTLLLFVLSVSSVSGGGGVGRQRSLWTSSLAFSVCNDCLLFINWGQAD